MNHRLLKISLCIVVSTCCLVVICLYLISKRPQNLTKKAPIFKKTYKVSSQKNCYSGGQRIRHETMHIPILLYHYVEFVKDKKDKKRELMSIHPNIFEDQLKELLQGGYTPIFVKEIPDIINGTPYTCTAVALTFDDGYVDFYTDVFPILKKYQVKATVYIISDYIGKKDFITDKQIKELIQSGLVEIGSHTITHADLTNVGLDIARNEIVTSKKALEQKYQIKINTFSYPFGHFNQNLEKIVQEASYSGAVTVKESIVQTSNVFQLSRLRPEKYLQENIADALRKVEN